MALEKNIGEYSRGLLDFHSHSTESDGNETPTQLANTAKKYGISAMALTDHNVISGLDEFNHQCKQNDIFSIPFGTEIHVELPYGVPQGEDNEAPDMIILGKNPNIKAFIGYQELIKFHRVNKFVPGTLDSLRELGFYVPEVSKEELEDINNLQIFHDFLPQKNNLDTLVKVIQDLKPDATAEEIIEKPKKFMNKHVYGVGGPAYIKRLEGFGLEDALGLVGDMNCKLFIAHPGGDYGFLSDSVLDYLTDGGVNGIETRSYFNNSEQNAKFDALAEKYDLIKSGGSDYHGETGAFAIGIHDRPENQVPKNVLKELWERLPD